MYRYLTEFEGLSSRGQEESWIVRTDYLMENYIETNDR